MTRSQGKKFIKTGRSIPIKREHDIGKGNNDLLSKKLNKFSEKEDWDSIIETLKPVLKKQPNDHWLLAEMASAYYEKRDYEKAFEFIAEAVSQNENCPLVLWHLASIERMRDKPEDAITVWEELINRGEDRIAYDECGEGIERARSLINDCRYMISKTYRELGKQKLADHFKDEYLNEIKAGVDSIYDPKSLQ
jgi:tetratricopeptide (TPR) repeat protein